MKKPVHGACATVQTSPPNIFVVVINEAFNYEVSMKKPRPL
jgi:hypothetical protein